MATRLNTVEKRGQNFRRLMKMGIGFFQLMYWKMKLIGISMKLWMLSLMTMGNRLGFSSNGRGL
uniref:Uncharacterized protein n=1 Tax=Meloidogyne enterolobii TaxID=390850 RepID=A0A6V7XLK8_MELEN|nr:unnamed protein product [Meloidogyne enterolobii]